MNAAEYAQTVLDAFDSLYTAIRTAMPNECQMERRFIETGTQEGDKWAGALVNRETKNIRLLVIRMARLATSDLQKTAGAKNFKPEVKFLFELFHDYEFGTDASNTETEFQKDALSLQFAIESNRSLPPLAVVADYDINLGHRPSVARSMHYGRGEILINFREIRY